MQVRIEPTWAQRLQADFDQPYFQQLTDFVRSEYSAGPCYPPASKIFAAFDLCPFDKVKVVILGQDPYHEPGQAEGLCFSVPPGCTYPPSLVNICKEILTDLGHPSAAFSPDAYKAWAEQRGVKIPSDNNTNLFPPSQGGTEGGSVGTEDGSLDSAAGSLDSAAGSGGTCWARQGVLLLNATLTVRAHQAGSHQRRGWEEFTDAVIRHLATEREGIVFILWGSYAQRKGAFIDRQRHCVLQSAHPSPLSAYRGFFGNHHFSQANAYLQQQGLSPIVW